MNYFIYKGNIRLKTRSRTAFMLQSYGKFSSTSYVQGCAKVEEDCSGVDCYHVKDMFEWKELIIILLLRLLSLHLSTESEMLR